MEPTSQETKGWSEEQASDRKVEQSLLRIPHEILTPSTKAQIAEAYLGLRPSTYQLIDSFREYDPEYARLFYRSNVQVLEHALKEIELPFFSSYNFDVSRFLVGNTLHDAVELKKAYEMPGSFERDRAFGLALGYPETAVEAFVEFTKGNRQAVISEEEIVDDIHNKEVLPFLNFWLSKEHWQEEVRVIEERINVLKKRMPLLYGQVIREE